MEQKEIKKNKILFIVGAIFLLILVIGGTFAYFQIVSTNNATNTTISGKGDLVGQATLTTNITELKLKLTAEMMSKDNKGKKYYATETGEGVTEPTLGNGEYVLGTASLTESNVPLNCTYSYDINISSTKPITDSWGDIILTIIEPSGIVTSNRWYDLERFYDEHTATIHNLKFNNPQDIKIMFSVYNSSNNQNDLSGNEFTITLTPKSGEEGFSCEAPDTLQESYSLTSDEDVSQMHKTDFYWSEFIKVSDDLPTPENLNNAFLYVETLDGEKNEIKAPLITWEKNVVLIADEVSLGQGVVAMVIYNTPEPHVDYDLSGAEPGIYIRNVSDTAKEISLKFPKVKSTYELAGTTDITNMTKIEMPEAEGQYLVKVSDDTLTYDMFINSVIQGTSNDGEVMSQKITDDLIVLKNENIIFAGGLAIVYNPTEVEGMNFTEPGIYLPYVPATLKEFKLILPKVYELSGTTNITYMTKVKHPSVPEELNGYLVKVSNDKLSLDEVMNSVGSAVFTDGTSMALPITSDLVTATEKYITISLNGMIGIVIAYEPVVVEGMNFTEPGIYMLYIPSNFKNISLILKKT